jgi:hypothetical protein
MTSSQRSDLPATGPALGRRGLSLFPGERVVWLYGSCGTGPLSHVLAVCLRAAGFAGATSEWRN